MSAPSTILPETLELPPLVVDLDRSLIRVDLLHEALARLGLRSPLRLLRLAWQHRKSLSAFKYAVAQAVAIDPRIRATDVLTVGD